MVGGIVNAGKTRQGVWGQSPPVGSRGKVPVGSQGAKPPEAEHFFTNYK